MAEIPEECIANSMNMNIAAGCRVSSITCTESGVAIEMNKQHPAADQINKLIDLGYTVGAVRSSQIGVEIDMVTTTPTKSADPFGNATGEDWQREIRRVISIDRDGDWEEYRG